VPDGTAAATTEGYFVGRHRIRRLMRIMGLHAICAGTSHKFSQSTASAVRISSEIWVSRRPTKSGVQI